jgi:dTMP kinase
MNLIVIEGLDGAGKSTQIKLLREYFDSKNLEYRYLHFPRTESPYFGEMISKFLRGEFGSLDEVDPYIVALLYAGDRKDASILIDEWLDKGIYVLLDRYVYSNIAYQCAKTKDSDERRKLKEWIMGLEFDHFAIPRPAVNIFLDVPHSFTVKELESGRKGSDRSYLNGNIDIHESSIQFQISVRDVYLEIAETDPTLKILSCSSTEGEMLPANRIHKLILDLLGNKKLIS